VASFRGCGVFLGCVQVSVVVSWVGQWQRISLSEVYERGCGFRSGIVVVGIWLLCSGGWSWGAIWRENVRCIGFVSYSPSLGHVPF
jgi:hypothetical protein